MNDFMVFSDFGMSFPQCWHLEKLSPQIVSGGMDTEKWCCLNIDVVCLMNEREIKQDPAFFLDYGNESYCDIQHVKSNKTIKWDYHIY